ncbi:GTPase-activating protein GYP3 [Spathaspora sp. JA1]|nr:GTPase-activating protein GYP3 [Spathaspora sp. JA1]
MATQPSAEVPTPIKSSMLLDPNEYNESGSASNSHQRNDSSYSRNFSLIDMYGDEAPNSPIVTDSNDYGSVSDEQLDSQMIKSLDEFSFGEASNEYNISQSTVNQIDMLNQQPQQVERNQDLEFREEYVLPTSTENEKKILKSPFDRYGFRKSSTHHGITLEDYNDWFKDYSEYSNRRKKKWEILMRNHGLPIQDGDPTPTRFPPKSDKVKKMIRKGIPSEWRGNAWFFYAGGYDKLNRNVGVYHQIVENTKNIHNKDTEVIERDLHRTFPDNRYFNASINADGTTTTGIPIESKETPLIESLRRVLIAFAHYEPQIGYCQSLNFLAGLLLLFMNEERSFWMLVILTERIIPKVHSADLEGVHTDQGVLMLCVKEYIPQLWGILGTTFEGERLSDDQILSKLPPVTLVTSSWFMSLFVGIMPTETTLRIWDILWCEGSKTVFRFALTILKFCLDSPEFSGAKRTPGAEADQIELFQFVQNFPKKILDCSNLVDLCFKKIGGYGFGSLSQDEINKCREFVSKQREKLNYKRRLSTKMTSEERYTLMNSSDGQLSGDNDIHDVYGFHRPIMGGVVWNRSISNKMKKTFAKRNSSRSST